jgi:hypothetical protein
MDVEVDNEVNNFFFQMQFLHLIKKDYNSH